MLNIELKKTVFTLFILLSQTVSGDSHQRLTATSAVYTGDSGVSSSADPASLRGNHKNTIGSVGGSVGGTSGSLFLRWYKPVIPNQHTKHRPRF